MTDNQEPKVEEKVEIKQENNSISPENEVNWRKFREERAVERKAAEEAKELARKKEEEARALKEAMEALLSKPSTHSHDSSSVDAEVDEEDIRIQKKIDAALAAERKKNEELQRQREARETPLRLKQMFNDFEEVCSQENVDRLEFDHPEIAAAFESMPNSLEKWSSVYKTIKKLIPNPKSANDQKKAEKNFSKPQSMSVSGVTQTGDHAPTILTEQKRKDNYARMLKVMKGL